MNMTLNYLVGVFFLGTNFKTQKPQTKVCYQKNGQHRVGVLDNQTQVTPTLDDGTRWKFLEVYEMGSGYVTVNVVEQVSADTPLGVFVAPTPVPDAAPVSAVAEEPAKKTVRKRTPRATSKRARKEATGATAAV